MNELSAVISKRGGVALGIWGVPGAGKTHTVQALLRELPCRSASVHATASSLALLHALPKAETLPVWAARAISRLETGASVEPKVFADVLSAWLATLAPFVLHVEDLHETTPERESLWMALAAAVTRMRGVGLLVTSRLEPREPLEAYALPPLEVKSAKELLASVAGAALPTEALAWITTQAQGNPLFTLEYFRHLTRLGYLWSDGQRWRWRAPEDDRLPTTVEAVVAQHLHAVGSSAATRAALEARSILPLETTEALWAGVAGLNLKALRAARADLERGSILRDGEFVHPLYRELTRSNLNRDERREFSRRAVTLLRETNPRAAAEFLPEAALGPNEERDLLERAIIAAHDAQDIELEARLLARVALTHNDSARRVELLLEASRVARAVNLASALELAQWALALNDAHVEARLLTADLLAALGRGDEAERALQPLARLEETGALESARLFEARVRVKHLSHDYAGVLNLWERHEPFEEPGAITKAMIARAMVQINQLEPARAVLAEALAAPHLTNLELAELLYVQSFVPYFAGQYTIAEVGFSAFLHTLQALSDGATGNAAVRYREMRSGTLQLRAYMRNVLGRPVEATQDLREALVFHAEVGDASHYAQLQSELGLYLLESGEYSASEDALEEARAVLERIDNPVYLTMLERIEARLHLERDLPHTSALALRHARAAMEQVERAGRPASYLAGAVFILGWAEARHGNAEHALRLADELEGLSAAHSGSQAGAAWLRGLALERLGRLEEAKRCLLESLELGVPMRLGPTLERMALELDRLQNDVSAARARGETFQSRGALGTLGVAQRYFPNLEHTTNEPDLHPTVRLEVLGALRITALERTWHEHGRNKVREFLVTLLEARMSAQDGCRDLELFDRLYADWPERKAASALKQLVYRLRNTLGSGAILRVSDGYALSNTVTSDAEEFQRTLETRLWRGPYQSATGATSNIAEALHATLRNQAHELETTQPLEAVRIGELLLEANPFDRDALALCLRALKAGGDAQIAKRLYAKVREQFEEIGESLPEAWNEFALNSKRSR
jgi:hypothetical protein